jgi:hypothetical protein
MIGILEKEYLSRNGRYHEIAELNRLAEGEDNSEDAEEDCNWKSASRNMCHWESGRSGEQKSFHRLASGLGV